MSDVMSSRGMSRLEQSVLFGWMERGWDVD